MLNITKVIPEDYANLIAHELANLLPMQSASEFANLKADIAANGMLQPIWLFEGRILDGRNRYRACRELSYAFAAADFREFESGCATAVKASPIVTRSNKWVTAQHVA